MFLSRVHFKKDTLFELARIALPMVVSQGTFAVMIFTDRYFMSQIDSVHMAAALGGGVAAFFSFCFWGSDMRRLPSSVACLVRLPYTRTCAFLRP